MKTIDGTARRGEDYVPINEIITFEPQQREKQVCENSEFSQEIYPFYSINFQSFMFTKFFEHFKYIKSKKILVPLTFFIVKISSVL